MPFLLLTALLAPQYVTAAEESFNYPTGGLHGQSGGSGWANSWYSENNGIGFAGHVTFPGYDLPGNKMTTQYEHGGNYRLIDSGPHASVTDNGIFGKDGTSIWITFMIQREPYSDDWYGGLGLFWQFNGGERLFMGSPYGFEEWGWDVPFTYSNPVLVPGTDCDVLATLVYRVDFQAGDERVRLWVNPPVAHPSTTADADATVADFRFNEIRLQSGSGGMAGFSMDAIKIEYESVTPTLVLTGGCPGLVSVQGINMTPNGLVYVARASALGSFTVPAGPCTGTVLGLSGPTLLATPTADAQGQFTLAGNLPASLCGTVHLQALDAASCVSSNTVSI